MEPAGGGAVAGKRGPIEGVAVVDGAVLVGERWFKDVDLAGGAARLLAGRCAAGIRLRLRFGGYRDGDGVGGVLPQLSQVSDGGAVRACEGDGDIHVGGLPRLQAVGVVGVGGLGQIQLNAAYLYGGAALQLAGSETAQQIDVIVLRCNGDGLDGDVYRGLGELPDGSLGVFAFIDAGPGVGGDIVAAQKAGLRLDAEADDQLMAPVGDDAVIRNGAHVVIGEVKACDADVIAVYRGSGAHGSVVLAPCVGVAVLTGAGVGLQRDIRGGGSGRKDELGGDDIPDHGFLRQGGGGAAALDVVGDLLEDVAEGTSVRRRQVVAGGTGRAVVGGHLLHEPVAGAVQGAAVLIKVACGLGAGTGGVGSGEDADGVDGGSGGLDGAGMGNGVVGDILLKAVEAGGGAVRKDDDHTVARFVRLHGVGGEDALGHVQTQIRLGGAAGGQSADGVGDHSLTGGGVHFLKNVLEVLVGDVVIGHTHVAAVASGDGQQLRVVAVAGLAGEAHHGDAVGDVVLGAEDTVSALGLLLHGVYKGGGGIFQGFQTGDFGAGGNLLIELGFKYRVRSGGGADVRAGPVDGVGIGICILGDGFLLVDGEGGIAERTTACFRDR